MGWTHYWQRPTELPEVEFAHAAQDCSKMIDAIGLPLAGFDGSGEPIISDERIVFNGGPSAACEPFEIARVEFDRRGRGLVGGFCKTEGLPYDLCVQAVLLILKHYLGDLINVTSDGADEDWEEARSRAHDVLGYGDNFKLGEK